jgi:hypothetical protein
LPGEPIVGEPSPKLSRVSPMFSRMTSPGAAKPSPPLHAIDVFVVGFTHGFTVGVVVAAEDVLQRELDRRPAHELPGEVPVAEVRRLGGARQKDDGQRERAAHA